MRGLSVIRLPAASARATAPPRLAADPAGGAVAAWAEGSDVVVAAVRGGEAREELRVGCLGPPLSIGLAGAASGPVVVWAGHDGTVLACVRRGRTWRGPAPLSAPCAGATLVDVAARDGAAVAVWTAATGAVEASSHRPDDGWAAEGAIGAPEGCAVTPRVALGPDGAAVAAWVGSRSQIGWAARTPAGRWSPGADLVPAGHGASGLRLEATPNGEAVMAWTAADAAVRTARLSFGQLAAARVANWHTAWTEPDAVSRLGDPCYGPRLAVGPAGALVAWHRVDGEVQACLIDPDGRPGAPEALTTPAEPGLYPWPALGDGRAVVAWRGDGDVLRAAALGPGGWSVPEALSAPGDAPEPPLAAVDGAGRVTLAF